MGRKAEHAETEGCVIRHHPTKSKTFNRLQLDSLQGHIWNVGNAKVPHHLGQTREHYAEWRKEKKAQEKARASDSRRIRYLWVEMPFMQLYKMSLLLLPFRLSQGSWHYFIINPRCFIMLHLFVRRWLISH